MLKVFVSHSSQDSRLAGAIATLLRVALSLQSHEIRCTSVDGYRLRGGSDTEEQLRDELLEAPVVVGLISKSSFDSAYVLFELGARWGTRRQLIPLLSPGTSAAILKGPIASLNALRSEPASLHQFVTEIAAILSMPIEPPAAYQGFIDQIVSMKPHEASSDPRVMGGPNLPQHHNPPKFGSGWGAMELPVKAKVGVIDVSGVAEIGLSAMQLDNIGHVGRYDAAVVSFLEKKPELEPTTRTE